MTATIPANMHRHLSGHLACQPVQVGPASYLDVGHTIREGDVQARLIKYAGSQLQPFGSAKGY